MTYNQKTYKNIVFQANTTSSCMTQDTTSSCMKCCILPAKAYYTAFHTTIITYIQQLFLYL